MEQNIFALAKELTSLKPSKPGTVLEVFRKHGYDVAWRPNSVILAMSDALVSCWDGRASTLDQAAAWREVWKYLVDAEMVRGSGGRSPVQQVLDILGDYRRMSAGAAPLADASTRDQAAAWRSVWAYCATNGMVRGSLTSNVEEVITALDDLRLKAQNLQAQAVLVSQVHEVSINSEFSDADLEKIKAAMRQNSPGTRISPTARSASLPKTPELWPTPSADKANEIEKLAIHFSGCRSNAKCIPHEGTREEFECLATYCMNLAHLVKDIYTGGMAPRDFRGLEERVAAWLASQEQPYDPANAKPCHPSHELYKTGDKDAPEQVQDRNGEVVLDQCRNCGRAESQLLDGEPCAEAANDNKPHAPEHYGAEMAAALDKLATVVEPKRLDVVSRLLVLQDTCYGLAHKAGWWDDLTDEDGLTDVRDWPKQHLDNWISAKLMLIVTEVAEAMEGHRKGLMDDKLPHRGMLEVELADAVIRIMDLAGGLNLDVAGAIVEKLAYNMSREDHKIENRMAAGGKSV